MSESEKLLLFVLIIASWVVIYFISDNFWRKFYLKKRIRYSFDKIRVNIAHESEICGIQSYCAEVPITECPFPAGHFLRDAWETGWRPASVLDAKTRLDRVDLLRKV